MVRGFTAFLAASLASCVSSDRPTLSPSDAAGLGTDALPGEDAQTNDVSGSDTVPDDALSDTVGGDAVLADAHVGDGHDASDSTVAMDTALGLDADVELDTSGAADTSPDDTTSPGDTADADGIGTVDPPVVTSAELEDASVEPGDSLALTWRTSDATAVRVAASGGIPTAALAPCVEVDDDGAGGCLIATPAALGAGALTLSIVAVGASGAESSPFFVGVSVGHRPEATLVANPALLPEVGGEVTLSWTATGAARSILLGSSGEVLVDTALDPLCVGGAPCAPTDDAVVTTTSDSATWTLIASNDFGDAAASASVQLEGAPRIEALSLGGADALGGQKVAISKASAELTWSVAEVQPSDELVLESAPLTEPNGSCETTREVDWVAVPGFPQAASAVGAVTVDGLDATAKCLRFTAHDLDTAAGQRDRAVFGVYRPPVVTALEVEDDSLRPGELAALSWGTSHAYDVALDAEPAGAVTAQDLIGCSVADGACEVAIQPGAPLGDVTFTLTALGEAGATDAMSVTVTIGEAPTITRFESTPASAASASPVTLAWEVDGADRLVLLDGDEALLDTTSGANLAAGERAVGTVTTTRSWRLSVSNAFGAAEATATTFIGPSIDTLIVDGQSALGGEVVRPTGPATVSWTTTSATGRHTLGAGPVPTGGACADAQLATVYVEDSPAPAASHALGFLTTNRCVRLEVANAEAPPQTSAASFLLRELPALTSVSRSPSSLPSGGGTVVFDLEVRGAARLTLTASYLTSSGNVIGTTPVCDEGSLAYGALTDSGTDDWVECTHQVVPCNILCLNGGVPSATRKIRYHLAVTDGEGDTVSSSSSDLEVTVQ